MRTNVPQVLLDFFLVGDVNRRAGHAVGLTVVVAQRIAASIEPAILASLGSQAKFGVIRHVAGKMFLQCEFELSLVVRMQRIAKRRENVWKFFVAIAKHLLEPKRVIKLAGSDIPVPDASTRSVGGELKSFFAFSQGHDVSLLLGDVLDHPQSTNGLTEFVNHQLASFTHQANLTAWTLNAKLLFDILVVGIG